MPPPPTPSLTLPPPSPTTSLITLQPLNTTLSLHVRTLNFFSPVIPGHESWNCPTMAFLITNQRTGRRLLFDAGARKDYWNYSPFTAGRFERGVNVLGMRVEKGVEEVLKGAGVELGRENGVGAVEEVIWSGRSLRQIAFTTPDTLQIGPFRAHDFFADGSFYLLDVPGHAVGHMCGLARTTPTSFVLLGADACHFPGSLRPSIYHPLPDTIPGLDRTLPSPCPCELFMDCHPAATEEEKRTRPYYSVSTEPGSVYVDPAAANESVRGLMELDGSEDVLVCLAHDPGLFEVLPLLNDNPKAEIGDWKGKGLKEVTRWMFLNELPRGGKAGRGPIVEGWWREGKMVQRAEALRRGE
ncbi:hypothetical protein AJ79_08629 [Helicocarpus griseus UAMH5409]|uniref:Metallo-beta-lactamase domain-containing protein n=1 Tax=Helicocarpus griseus UAMH5409 TaxID=1447875 RepID=A0A2B7WRW5_9EURO|nr:hypothetical protein AJ79_08629 [Helicocarpus griseus UAMH5409]